MPNTISREEAEKTAHVVASVKQRIGFADKVGQTYAVLGSKLT